MKNLELLDLENIYGGNRWQTIGEYIFCAIIIAEIFYLQYKVTYLAGGSKDINDMCIYMPLSNSTINIMDNFFNPCRFKY